MPPPQTIAIGDTKTMNPAFTQWKRQYKLIYSGFLGTISTTITPFLSRATTAAAIWETLASPYAKPSRGHIKQLKQQLKQWKKRSKTTDEYLQGLTTKFDQLAILEKVVEHEEAKLLTVAANVSPGFPASANVESHRQQWNSNNNSRNPNKNPHLPQQQWNSNNNNNNTNKTDRAPRPYLGKCQFCGIQGHSARRCSLNKQVSPYMASQLMSILFWPWQLRENLPMSHNTRPITGCLTVVQPIIFPPISTTWHSISHTTEVMKFS